MDPKQLKPLSELLDELRDIDGFPLGKDEDILALSDPPYYTACPNPYLNEFIQAHGKPYDPETDDYHREPFVGDMSEGKNDPFFNAHSYHTKVPPKAIMKYIQYYTDKGDIVFDSFCGTGMTGVAAQRLNRKAILSELSPIATFIAHNYNHIEDVTEFEFRAKSILREVEKECGWMYQTLHSDGENKGIINYMVWSDVFICPYCNNEYVFWEKAVDKITGKVFKEYKCSTCDAQISKNVSKRSTITLLDKEINVNITQTKQIPVLINYTFRNKSYEKQPDVFDLEIIKKISEFQIPYWYPTNALMNKGKQWGDTWRAGYHLGITHVHHFYTKRNLWILAAIKNKCKKSIDHLWFSSQLINVSRLNRYRPGVSFPYNPLSGTLYIGSQICESNIFKAYTNKIKRFKSTLNLIKANNYVQIISATNINLPDSIIDYIFTDPPFGDNLMYSELNFIMEAWLKVFTNNSLEAIINNSQRKSLNEYYELMLESFREYYRVLKPNRWITVVFHNSKSSVWNAIQEAITKAGFIIAQVSVLDKQQGTYKQVTAAGAVKNDLVISAYKPSQQFEQQFLKSAGVNLEVEFLTQFIRNVPIQPVIERSEKMLYSKMLAYYIQHGYEVRYNASSFYQMLSRHFVEEDGYWFTGDQLESYREYKKRMRLEGIAEVQQGAMLLFISDENSALLWLFNFLQTPKSFSEIHTAYTKISEISGDQVPELRDLLENNFVFENGEYRRPQSEQERLSLTERRERELLREFEALLLEARSSKKKIKEVRKQAVLHGFEVCYKTSRFADILLLAKRLDPRILENNADINEFVEIAEIKQEGF